MYRDLEEERRIGEWNRELDDMVVGRRRQPSGKSLESLYRDLYNTLANDFPQVAGNNPTEVQRNIQIAIIKQSISRARR